eukprot:COSAG04_NODE_26209_length_298_cov_0.522613_1_plen_29_part_01
MGRSTSRRVGLLVDHLSLRAHGAAQPAAE